MSIKSKVTAMLTLIVLGMALSNYNISARAKTFLTPPIETPSTSALVGLTGCCPNYFAVIDPVSGIIMPLHEPLNYSAFGGFARTSDSTHNQYYIIGFEGQQGYLVGIDSQTGVVTGNPPLSLTVNLMGFDPITDTLFGITTCCPNYFATINPTTGEIIFLNEIGDNTVGFLPDTTAVNSSQHLFYLAKHIPNGQGGTTHLMTIDIQTGNVITESPPLTSTPIFLGFDPQLNTLFGITTCCPNKLVTIEPATGNITLSWDMGYLIAITGGGITLDANTHRLVFAGTDTQWEQRLFSIDLLKTYLRAN